MSQAGFTPIQLFRTSTAAAAPTAGNLADGELAINLTDERLFFKNAAGTVKLLAANITPPANGGTGVANGTNNTITFTGNHTLGLTLTGTTAVTLPTTGTLATLVGTETLTNKTVEFVDGSAAAPSITNVGDTNTGMFFPAADTIAATVGGSEQMRLTSTGLGIGTTSPGARLHSVSTSAGLIATQLLLSNADGTDGTGAQITFSAVSGGTTPTGSLTNVRDASGSYSLRFATFGGGNNTERMRLDSSGNLGLGVTPGGWGGNNKAFQVANASFWGSTSLTAYASVGSNYAVNSGGGYGYISSNAAADYYQFNGTHVWRTAASGTAGDAISFTQAATLTAAGDFLVGTTSNQTGAKVNAAGGVGTTNTATNRFATVEYGSGANGTFTTITTSFTVDGGASSVILEVLMTGFSGVYLDHVAARYANQTAVVMRNNASAGTTVASLAVDGATTTYTLTITTYVTHPVVKVKATVGGLGSTTTLPTITFA
jgi:hypothetical protein